MQTGTVAYECQTCGEIFAKWQGKCDTCQAWNTLSESKKQRPNKKTARITTLHIEVKRHILIRIFEHNRT